MIKIAAAVLFLVVLSCCSAIDDIINITPDVPPNSSPGTVKFVAIGDTGTGGQGQYDVAAAIKKKCQTAGCDFVLILGDNVYSSGVNSVNDSQFDSKFEDPYQNIDLPFYLVLGNHDYGGGGKGYDPTKTFYQIEYSEESEKWNMPRHFYRFKQEHATFIALDTNAQMYGIDEDQREQVSQWLDESQTPWIIAFGHHPYLSNGPHGNAGNYEGVPGVPIVSGDGVKDFAETVWCGKVDLYLSGHDHSRQWLGQTCQGTALAVTGAGAKTTTLPGGNAARFQSATLGFLYVTVTEKTLTAEFIDVVDNTEFTYTLSKP